MTLYRSFCLIVVSQFVSFSLSAQVLVPPATPAETPVASDLQVRVVARTKLETVINSRDRNGFTIEVTNAEGMGVPDAAVVIRLPESGPTGTFIDGTHAFVAYTDQTGRASGPDIQWNSIPGLVAIRVSATKGTAHAGILIEETLTAAGQPTAPALEPGTLAKAQPPSAAVPPLRELPGPPARSWSAQPAAAPQTPAQQPETVTRAASAPPQSPTAPPSVTVTGGSPEVSTHSAKKWIVIAAIAVGAGVAVAMAMGSKSKSSTTTPSALSVGQPTLSVGQ